MGTDRETSLPSRAFRDLFPPRFDAVVLLRLGAVAYLGPRQGLRSHLAASGFPLKDEFSLPEHALYVVQTCSKEDAADLADRAFVTAAPPRRRRSPADASSAPEAPPPPSAVAATWRQAACIAKRDLRTQARDPRELPVRVGVTIVASALVGALYYEAGRASNRDFVAVETHFSLLFMMAINVMMGVCQPLILCFAGERPVVLGAGKG